ncbi:MAG: hypothetical protein HRU20_08730 [Pseudomonadales bacterium]|nr:hypothetical protein [Pseudomonadales bacterium]
MLGDRNPVFLIRKLLITFLLYFSAINVTASETIVRERLMENVALILACDFKGYLKESQADLAMQAVNQASRYFNVYLVSKVRFGTNIGSSSAV